MSQTYIIAKDDVKKFVAAVKAEFNVYGPVPKRGTYIFDTLDDVDRLDLSYDNSMMSPKKYLLPPEEVMMHFDLKEKSVEDALDEVKTAKSQLILGVHNCDIHGKAPAARIKDDYCHGLPDGTAGFMCCSCDISYCFSYSKDCRPDGQCRPGSALDHAGNGGYQ